ncbi:hypothetical protein [Edaphobacter sp. 12200R-103]|jgi:hypothetical protein|uniref:hypothetical protein n=1 Tax=Edaphobacter sp. 12200R-103 TaxID=2703788 RepID=UPI00138BA6CA|nr:hypothetical protein [Edaphobacter sp. 12200R-103]QHS53281.1 hypothetical protein GWR55_17330 [Edaphobacter sp. 12200R-103]
MSARISQMALRYARIALAISFLSPVADRFGLLGRFGGWGNFAAFTAYTAKVNSFMPASTIPFLAWSATAGELVCGFGLLIYAFVPSKVAAPSSLPRILAFASSILLLLFAVSMTISLGIKKPLDYSVFSASACALLLALYPDAPSRPG